MTEVREERRLAAIVIGDVVGYSRMMGLDDVGTMNALKAHRRDLILPLLTTYRARLVNTTGDAMLLEFGSAVDAVACAASLQRGMLSRNARTEPDRQIRFRLGINLGDIVIDGNDIYGDGVNVAARLEQICEPGGICLSRAVEEQVKDKLPYPFEDRGEQELKNIARPIRVYALGPEAIAVLPEPAVLTEKRVGTTQLHITPGTRLNDAFAVDRLIGSGGMGEIFEGHELATGDAVAIKFIRLDMEANETTLSLFQKEASVLKQVHHEAVIRYSVFSFDPTIRRHYLAMEFVDGPSLSELQKRGPLAVELVDTLRKRIAAGLQAAHDRGIVHRDISPDNIILPGGDVARAKIIDFGIARAATLGGGTIIGGGFAGKYNYVSPEQLGLFGGDVGNRSDIYSFGLVLMGALLGEPVDMGGSQAEIIDKRRVVPDLSGVDARLRPIIELMLQPDPANRPASMAEVAAWTLATPPSRSEATAVPVAERTVIAPRPAPAVPSSPTLPPSPFTAPAEPPSPMPRPATTASASTPNRSSRTPLIVGVAAVLLLAGGGLVALRWPSGTSTEKPQSPTVIGPTVTPTTQPAPTPEPAVTPTPSPAQPEQPTINPTPVPEPQPSPTPGPSATVETPPAQPASPGAATKVASFLDGYDGGPCFFAAAVAVSDTSAGIQSFASTPDAFERFADAFKKTVGFEPSLTGNRLWSKQCPAAGFLRQAQASGSDRPDLFLKSARLRSGQTLSGEISGTEDQSVLLLRVKEDGTVDDLTKQLKDKAGAKDFDVPLSQDGPGPYPQLILAIASSTPLASPGSGQADKVFPALLKAASDRKGKLAVTAKLVLLGG